MTQFRWSAIQPAEVLEESRAARFRPEWRPLLFSYLGLAEGMQVLEVCCGPGTLAPYLAAGIAPGSVTGLDLDAEFIARASAKAEADGLRGVRYIVGDAYALPFPDASFDAVTSYTGIGILADPRQAIAEMVRVCRPKGAVSIAEAGAGPGGITFDGIDALEGQAPYDGAPRLRDLSRRLHAGYSAIPRGVGSSQWPVRALWALMAELGLGDLRLNAWGHVMAPDDSRTPAAVRLAHRRIQQAELEAWIDELLSGEDYRVLSRQELLELRELGLKRQGWAMEHPLWDWEASLSLAAVGRKL